MVLSSWSRSHLVLERSDFLSHVEPHWENKVQGTLKHTFQGGFSPRAAGHREGRGQGHSSVEVARGLGPATGSCCHIISLEGEKQVWRLCHRCLRACICQGLAASSPSVCPRGSGSPLPVTIFRKFRGEGSCPQLRATWRLTLRTLCSGTVSAPGRGGPGTCAPRGGFPPHGHFGPCTRPGFLPPVVFYLLRPPLGAGGLARCHLEMVRRWTSLSLAPPGGGPGSFWRQSPGGGRVTGEGAPGGRRRLGCWEARGEATAA